MFADVKFYGNSIKKKVDAFGVFAGHRKQKKMGEIETEKEYF
jgi:hypothetical protein